MRRQISKGRSTRGERKFHELLKKLKIPFKYKAIIKGREIDFIVGKYAIEIDGHFQDATKNQMLIGEGYVPVHLSNWNVSSPEVEEWLKKI